MKGCRSDWGVTKNLGLGEGCWLPPSPCSDPPQALALARRSTHPLSSPAVVFSLGARDCEKNIHPVNPGPFLCWPRPVTVITHLLRREIPASPGKPPPPTLSGHLLLLQLVHGALRTGEGHGISLHPANHPWGHQDPDWGLTLKQGAVNIWTLRKHTCPHSGILSGMAWETKGHSCLSLLHLSPDTLALAQP